MTAQDVRTDALPAARPGAYLPLLAMCLLWTGGIFLPALAALSGRPPLPYALLRFVYAPFCHQDAARCFHIGSTALTVCGRCTAIYAAFTAVVAAYPLLRRIARRIARRAPGNATLALLLLPMAMDVALDAAGILRNSMLSRAATGAVAGAALGLFTVPAWLEVWHERHRARATMNARNHATDPAR
jgi:uncharacterized membrane protein